MSSVAVSISLFCDNIISGEFFIYFPLPKYICVTYYKLSWAFLVLFISRNYVEKHFIYNFLLIGGTIVLYNVEGLAAQLEAFICNFLLLCCYFLHSLGPYLFDKIWMCTVHFNHITECRYIQFPLAQANWLTWPSSLLKRERWSVIEDRQSVGARLYCVENVALMFSTLQGDMVYIRSGTAVTLAHQLFLIFCAVVYIKCKCKQME